MCHGIGPVKFRKLLSQFGTAEIAWKAGEKELLASGIGPAAAEVISAHRKHFSLAAYVEKLQKLHVDYVTMAEPAYPTLLAAIARPPFVLYIKGNKDIVLENDASKIAIVGTRKVTGYGRQVTALLAEELSQAGCIIISGLAMGVDALAHTATLRADGKTIAVLGSGVDYCTPKENEALYTSIIQKQGAIISEMPLGYMPNKGSFPARNRIIAGLSQGVLVTEGAEDSGSLITAHDAIAEGRKVFAVPGPITSSVSKGPISLIARGAKIVTNAQDVLKELGIEKRALSKMKRSVKGDSPEEQKILDSLENENLSFDEIVKKTSLPAATVGMILSLFELKGIIGSANAKFFLQ